MYEAKTTVNSHLKSLISVGTLLRSHASTHKLIQAESYINICQVRVLLMLSNKERENSFIKMNEFEPAKCLSSVIFNEMNELIGLSGRACYQAGKPRNRLTQL